MRVKFKFGGAKVQDIRIILFHVWIETDENHEIVLKAGFPIDNLKANENYVSQSCLIF